MCSLAPLSTINNGVAQLRLDVDVDAASGAEVDVSPASDAFVTMVVDFIRNIRSMVRTVRRMQHVKMIDLPYSLLLSTLASTRQHPKNPWDADSRPASSAFSRSSFSSISFSFGQFRCQCFIPGQNLHGGPGFGVCPPVLFFFFAFAPSRVQSSMLPSLPRVLVMRGFT
eukprot:116612-Prorocentrum_minimum.AAC.1